MSGKSKRYGNKTKLENRSSYYTNHVSASAFKKMSIADKKKIINKLNSTANKRIANIRKNDLQKVSTAMHGMSDKFKFKLPKNTKDEKKIIEAYISVKSFLFKETSSVEGIRENQNRSVKSLKDMYGIDFEKGLKKQFKSNNPNLKGSAFSLEFKKFKYNKYDLLWRTMNELVNMNVISGDRDAFYYNKVEEVVKVIKNNINTIDNVMDILKQKGLA